MDKVFAYLRVSTDDQNEHFAPAQEQAIIEYCKDNDLQLIEMFKDIGASGTTIERNGLFQLICGFIGVKKVVVVNTGHLWENDTIRLLIIRQFELADAEIISIEQPDYSIAGDNPNNYFFDGIMQLLDQYERMITMLKSTRERKLKAASIKGLLPMGYIDKNEGEDRSTIIIDDNQAAVVRLIYTKYMELGSIAKVKIYLNENGYKTKIGMKFNDVCIINILTNEFYTGTVIRGSLDTEDQHDPIIDRALFEQVQRINKRNTRMIS